MNTHSIPADTILQGDCLSLMAQLPDNFVDLVLCDLPYGITDNTWDRLIPLVPLWREYRRIVKPAGYVILTAQGLFASALMESNRRQFSHKIIWAKQKPAGFLNAKRMPLKIHEEILVFRMGRGAPYHPQFTYGHKPYTNKHNHTTSSNYRKSSHPAQAEPIREKDDRRYPVDIVQFPASSWDRHLIHPTQKPVEMGRYLVRQYSDPGALVLDNCCGSGAFLISALLERRRFLGMEASEAYADNARVRIANTQHALASLRPPL